ncbi:MAG: helix-turn-helix domain-containing protein [Firmicutes bacterium]|nr:helix-turn-helix domain-containing protein [Bacillota bacterium]
MKEHLDGYIGIDEAAAYLGIKTVTLRGWIKKNKVPVCKIGKLWKFKRSELDEWVKSGESAFN